MQRNYELDKLHPDFVKVLCNLPASVFEIMPDGNLITYLYKHDLTIHDSRTGEVINKAHNPTSAPQGFLDLKFTHSGDLVTIDLFGESIDIWDSKTLAKKHCISAPQSPWRFDVYGSQIISHNRDKTITFFDLNTGTQLKQLEIEKELHGMLFTGQGDVFLWDDRYLYTLTHDSLVTVLDVSKKVSFGGIRFVTKLQDDKLALSLSSTIYLYDPKTKSLIKTFLKANNRASLASFANGDLVCFDSTQIKIQFQTPKKNVSIECYAGSIKSTVKATPNGKLYITNGCDDILLYEIDYRQIAQLPLQDKFDADLTLFKSGGAALKPDQFSMPLDEISKQKRI